MQGEYKSRFKVYVTGCSEAEVFNEDSGKKWRIFESSF